MASPLDRLAEIPLWQIGAIWAGGAVAVGAIWYFVYFGDVVTERDQAQAAVTKAEAELARVKDEFENYETRVKEQAERDKELERLLEVVPVDSSTIDHLMSTFQREARMVGLELERWIPQAEQRRREVGGG